MKILKKITIRYIKSLIYDAISYSPRYSKFFGIYARAIAVDQIRDSVNITKVEDSQGKIFLSQEVFGNILTSEATGVSLIEDGNIFKGIHDYTGKIHRNWVRPSICRRAKTIDGLVINLLGVHKGSRHFFHIFFDYIFPLLYFIESSKEKRNIKILVRENFTNVQSEIYQVISENFDNLEFVAIKKGDYVKCQRLIYIKHYHQAFYDFDRNPQVKNSLLLLRKLLIARYHIKKDTSNGKLIYIARKARLRKVWNHRKFQKMLENSGFETRYLEGVSLKEQVEIFFNAKKLVAVHGAALTNLIFANSDPDFSFIELYPKRKAFRNDFYRISKILSLKRLEYVEGNEYFWESFYVNLSRFKEVLKSL